jgi:hypothetical protein
MIGFINTNSVTSLIIAAVILAAIAVIVDRLNFPQKPFRPKRIETGGRRGPARDRTGAHIVDVTSDASEEVDDLST